MEALDPGIIDRLVTAIASGDWPVIVGGSLLVLAAAVLYVADGRVSKTALAWLSLVRGVFVGVGAPLVAGGDWKISLTAGLVGLIASAGFLDRIRALLPERKDDSDKDDSGGASPASDSLPKPSGLSGASATVVVLLLAVVLSGCSVRQAQVGVRTALTSADEGIASADRIIAVDAERQSESVLSGIEEQCGRPCFDAVERYRDGMARWYDAARGLRASHEALLALDAALEAWIQSGDLPAGWSELCSSAAESLTALVESVSAATGREAPSALSVAPAVIEGACQLAEPYVARIGGDDEH